MVDGIESNATSITTIPVVVSYGMDGYCIVGSYSIEGTTYSSVVVIARVKTTLKDFWAKVTTDDDKVHLPFGRTCRFADLHCQDLNFGDVTWQP